ncbi:MAG: class II aldolase/adducin family protein [Sporolactobacillus sp.]
MGDGRIIFEHERVELAKVAKLVYERKLTNTVGGNISMKVHDEDGNSFYIMTPTMMSEAYLGHLSPEQILVIEPHTRKIASGVGNLTREINMHEAVYDANPNIMCVFHSHAPNALAWATSGLPMPNLTEATQKVKGITTLKFEPNCSESLAELVGEHISNHIASLKTQGVSEDKSQHMYLLNSHGVLATTIADNPVAALHKALAIVDTVETNAIAVNLQLELIQQEVLDGFYSKGVKVATLDELKEKKEIWNEEVFVK